MRVTTGGITVTVGVVIVLALGAAGVKVVREEANDPTSAFDDCEPQTRVVARAARRHLVAQYVRPAPQEGRWFNGAYTTTAEAARQMLDSIREEGVPVSDRIPEGFGEGYIVVVHHDPAADLPSLPRCVEGTPVLYVGKRV